MKAQRPLSSFLGNGVYTTLEELLFEGHKAKEHTLHLRKRVMSARGGLKRSSIRSRGMEFFESRPYVAADEMRTIDWKVSARKNALYTKIFIEEKDRPIFIVVDLRSHMFFGTKCCFKSVLAAKIAAQLATAAQSGGDRVGAFFLFDSGLMECPKGSSKKSLALFFGKLALATKNTEFNNREDKPDYFKTILSRINNRVESGAAIFMISDFKGLYENSKSYLYRLRKRADIFALSIKDPLEEKMPSLGMVGMLDGNRAIQFDSSNVDLENSYRTHFLNEQDKILKLFKSLDIPSISFCTAEAVEPGLKRIFEGRW